MVPLSAFQAFLSYRGTGFRTFLVFIATFFTLSAMPPLTLLLSSTSCFLGFSKVRQTFLLQFVCLRFGSVSNNFHLCLHAFGGATNCSSCSLTFESRMPKIKRSLSISSGVIVSKLQLSASLRSVVLYWS